MSQDPEGPWLFTPGPINTSEGTRRAMLRDFGSRDPDFIALTARLRARLVEIAGGGDYACVPLQGGGTFAVEAALGSLVPRDGKVLILVNGVYGRRMAQICATIRRPHEVLETEEHVPPQPRAVAAALSADPGITHVAVIHCETTSGILNPLEDIAAVVARAGRKLLVDAMSTFGILPLDVERLGCEAVMASSNKCLEGVPGLAFVIAHRPALERSAGNAPSLSLDLHDQWRFMERSGQWRFTPPTHVAAALDQALKEYAGEGGRAARLARYQRNRDVLLAGMRGLGFETLLPDDLQGPVIVTFLAPGHPNFTFERFYDGLRRRGYVIYPGKLTRAPSFRVGCIGQLREAQMQGLVAAVREVIGDMGVTSCAPAGAARGARRA